jgi:hypothetical protein
MGLFLEEACILEWRSVEPRKKRNLIAKPQKSLQLYVPVSAHFDAHSSVYGWVVSFSRSMNLSG